MRHDIEVAFGQPTFEGVSQRQVVINDQQAQARGIHFSAWYNGTDGKCVDGCGRRLVAQLEPPRSMLTQPAPRASTARVPASGTGVNVMALDTSAAPLFSSHSRTGFHGGDTVAAQKWRSDMVDQLSGRRGPRRAVETQLRPPGANTGIMLGRAQSPTRRDRSLRTKTAPQASAMTKSDSVAGSGTGAMKSWA